MHQKVLLFCIYFSLNNFNYQKKSWQSHQNQQNSSAKVSRNSRKSFAEKNKTCLGFGLRSIGDCREEPLRQRRHLCVVSRLVGRPLGGVHSKLNTSLNKTNNEG